MKQFDVAVIGGGILGCFAARNLRRYAISTVLIEAEADVCTGITRANSAIVYAGYDNKPDSLKAELTVRGNAGFDALCAELEVPFSRCGSLMVSCDAESDRVLEKKLRQGQANHVPGLRLLSGDEARAMEPMLTDRVTSALYAPTTGTVNPWQLGIAAYENARQNGCKVLLHTAVTEIVQESGIYRLDTTEGEIRCAMVLNCAGANADRVQELLFPPSFRLELDGADYLVLDSRAEKPAHVIFHQAGPCGKGITAIPCTEGNLLLSGSRRPQTVPYATTQAGLTALTESAKALLPGLDLSAVIRSFGALRPNPHRVVEQNGRFVPDGTGIGSFCIDNPAPGFYSLIGIKTPGLTCANELGLLLASYAADYLRALPNPDFDPHRPAISASEGDEILCLCQTVTKGQVLEAIRRGAVSVDGVKRRTGCAMGRCQGGRCTQRIEELLGTAGQPVRGNL